MTTAALTQPEQHSGDVSRPLGKAAVERRRRALSVVICIVFAVLVLTTSSRWPIDGLGRDAMFLIGMFLANVGALGRIWSNLFISGYKSKDLVQTGPYSLCRNPLYFFSAIGMTGVGLCTATLATPVLLIVFFAIYYPMIIDREERRLDSRHPDAFEKYCRTTSAFWPGLRHYWEPDAYMMYPRVMRKNLADAFWFVGLAAIVHVASRLHTTGALPEFARMW